jgi:hypothetical protein
MFSRVASIDDRRRAKRLPAGGTIKDGADIAEMCGKCLRYKEEIEISGDVASLGVVVEQNLEMWRKCGSL